MAKVTLAAVPLLPDKLVQASLAAKRGAPGGGADGTSRSGAPPIRAHMVEGSGRNHELTSLAGSMRRRGLSAAQMYPSVAQVNQDNCAPPLGERELWLLLNSVARYAPSDVPFQGIRIITEDEESGYRHRVWRTEESRRRPQPRWLVHGVLAENTVVALTGESGSYKSFIALSLALAIASGQDWHGRPVQQGEVVYLVGEGGAAFDWRVEAWEIHHGLAAPECFGTVDHAVLMADPTDVEALIDDLKLQLEEPPKLIIVDTLARAVVGKDENSAQDMGVLVQQCDRLRKEFGCTVVLLHHLGKSGLVRGSTAVVGALDTHLAVRKDRHGRVTLSCEKQKDYEPFEAITLQPSSIRLSRLDEVTGAHLTSLVFDALTKEQVKAARQQERAGEAGEAGEDGMLSPLLATITAALALCNPRGAQAGEWQKMAELAEVGRSAFFAQFPRLLTAGVVLRDDSGRYPLYRLASSSVTPAA